MLKETPNEMLKETLKTEKIRKKEEKIAGNPRPLGSLLGKAARLTLHFVVISVPFSVRLRRCYCPHPMAGGDPAHP